MGVDTVIIEIDASQEMLAAMDARDQTAEAASLGPVLRPSSVVVVGAGHRERSVGHQVLRNILDGGFTGEVYVVNPHRDQVLGVASWLSAADLPATPDLAVVAVPAAGVVDVVRDCGRRGVRAVLVLTSGFGEIGPDGSHHQDRVLAVVRHYGMRMVGPNCLGLLNTGPAVRLNATFATLPLDPGPLGLVSQSGALGIAVLVAAGRCGLGISQFVSIGNKADVSANDLLMAWQEDEPTRAVALYLESFGNPRKFVRIARRVSRRKPVIAIKAGRSEAGRRAGQSHTAAAASSDVVVDAMFHQAGVIRVDSMERMLDAARVLCDQPLPAGPRIGIIGNSGGPGILAADAATAAELTVVELSDDLRAAIMGAVPGAASSQNPVDLGAGAQPAEVQHALEVLLGSDEIDAVLGVFTQTLVADPAEIMAVVARAAGSSDLPVVVTQVGDEARSYPIEGTTRSLTVFAFPEPAAYALALAWRYQQIRSAPIPTVQRPTGTDVAGARHVVADALTAGGGWLGPGPAAVLLASYGIIGCPHRLVGTADEAVAAAAELGYPVVLKIADKTVHKTDIGGVTTDVRDDDEVREAYTRMSPLSTARLLMQPMISGGTELIVGGIQEQQFGPVVMIGAGGVLADLLGDRQFGLAPLGEPEAMTMVNGLRFGRLLDGYRGRPPVSRKAAADVVVRLGWLLDDLPQVVEVDLNPVMASGEQLVVVDAKIRIAPAPDRPEFAIRQLHDPSTKAQSWWGSP